MVRTDPITKVAFTGNTELTYKSIEAAISTGKFVSAVFGVPDEKSMDKTNHVYLDSLCEKHDIKLFRSEDWEEYKSFCLENNVDTIITMGDSRIIPKTITDSFYVIGNHGAILPNVKGGASLVWGRLLNAGFWGISIMEIGEGVDTGTILKTKEFTYDENMNEQEFVETCDDLTVNALLDVLNGDSENIPNRNYDVRISKNTDSESATEILRWCLQRDLSVYMPPRNEKDSELKSTWSEYFKNVFKIAQYDPYPRWTEGD